MFNDRHFTVSDNDVFNLLASLTHTENTSFGPVAFDADNAIHREALNRGLVVTRPWPLAMQSKLDRQCLLVSVTTGWQWMRAHRPAPLHAEARQDQPH